MEEGSGSGKRRDTDYGYTESDYLSPPPNLEVDPNPPPKFTFIEHNDSLITKRIRDPQARRAIRSHVMRDVRFREKQQGKRRGSKREKASKEQDSSVDRPVEIKYESDANTLVASPESVKFLSPVKDSTSPTTGISREFETGDGFLGSRSKNVKYRGSVPVFIIKEEQSSPPGTISPSQITIRRSTSPSQGLIDPFNALPGDIGHSSLTQRLVSYCSDVFLPMTFPIDSRRSRDQQRLLVTTLMQDLRSDASTFYAALTAAAGHNAILRRRHEDLAPRPGSDGKRRLFDPDYYIMETQACGELNKKLSGEDWLSSHAFQSILSLIGATCVTANFEKTQIHLGGLKRMIAARGGVHDPFFSRANLITESMVFNDIKAAMGLNSRPILPLFWPRESLSDADMERILPPISSVLNRLATKFNQIPGLSPILLNLLDSLRHIYFLHDLGIRGGGDSGLNHADYQLFSRKCTEFEYDLLEYPWLVYGPEGPQSAAMHPLEKVVRTTILDLFKNSFVVALPASGLGRASTTALVNSLTAPGVVAYDSPSPAYHHHHHPAIEELIMWACLIGIPGAKDLPEEEYFLDTIAKTVARSRPGMTFDRLVDCCSGFVYVPSLMEQNWRESWRLVQARLGYTSFAVL